MLQGRQQTALPSLQTSLPSFRCLTSNHLLFVGRKRSPRGLGVKPAAGGVCVQVIPLCTFGHSFIPTTRAIMHPPLA